MDTDVWNFQSVDALSLSEIKLILRWLDITFECRKTFHDYLCEITDIQDDISALIIKSQRKNLLVQAEEEKVLKDSICLKKPELIVCITLG